MRRFYKIAVLVTVCAVLLTVAVVVYSELYKPKFPLDNPRVEIKQVSFEVSNQTTFELQAEWYYRGKLNTTLVLTRAWVFKAFGPDYSRYTSVARADLDPKVEMPFDQLMNITFSLEDKLPLGNYTVTLATEEPYALINSPKFEIEG